MIPPLPGVVTLDFRPGLRIGEVEVRWDALALAAVLLLALAPWVRGIHARTPTARWSDMALVLAATVVGAVVGGRVVHVLGFLDVYAADPVAALDLGRGTGSLVGAALGGMVAGAWVCRLLGSPGGAWADAAAVPLLVAIGGGKLALLLDGGGQGAPWDGAWALAYAGEGSWRSLDPAVPAWPSQALEGAWAWLGIPVVPLVERRLMRHGRGASGSLLLLAVAWWLAGRAVVAATWRDEPVAGVIGAEGLATVGALVAVIVAAVVVAVRAARSPGTERSGGGGSVAGVRSGP